MEKEVRTIVYDDSLKLEAYYLRGIAQPFPNHFHEHYVMGLVESGKRHLCCGEKEYIVSKGDILLFHPYENHSCVQKSEESFEYRGLNIPKQTILDLMEDLVGERRLLKLSDRVITDVEIACIFRSFHEMILQKEKDFAKEEKLLMLFSNLLEKCEEDVWENVPECRVEVEKACKYMEENFSRHIRLEEICQHVGLSKSTLLRAFTKEKGIAPYQYFETIRINRAKMLLEQGAAPMEAAMKTGFSDQSHFTKYFIQFIGVAPGVYRRIFGK